MYELLFFVIGIPICGTFWFWCNRKQVQISHKKDRPFVTDTHIIMARQGDVIMIIGIDEFYAHEIALTSFQDMCRSLKEKDIEIILILESFIKNIWIILHDILLPKHGDNGKAT